MVDIVPEPLNPNSCYLNKHIHFHFICSQKKSNRLPLRPADTYNMCTINIFVDCVIFMCNRGMILFVKLTRTICVYWKSSRHTMQYWIYLYKSVVAFEHKTETNQATDNRSGSLVLSFALPFNHIPWKPVCICVENSSAFICLSFVCSYSVSFRLISAVIVLVCVCKNYL